MQIGWIGAPVFCGHFVADSGMFLLRTLPLKKKFGSWSNMWLSIEVDAQESFEVWGHDLRNSSAYSFFHVIPAWNVESHLFTRFGVWNRDALCIITGGQCLQVKLLTVHLSREFFCKGFDFLNFILFGQNTCAMWHGIFLSHSHSNWPGCVRMLYACEELREGLNRLCDWIYFNSCWELRDNPNGLCDVQCSCTFWYLCLVCSLGIQVPLISFLSTVVMSKHCPDLVLQWYMPRTDTMVTFTELLWIFLFNIVEMFSTG